MSIQPEAGSPPELQVHRPDGLIAERAYDLAIPMREWRADLLAGDSARLGRVRCQPLAALTWVAPEPI